MDKGLASLGFGGISVPLGSHIASFYRNCEEQRAVTLPFIKAGLEQGAGCVYVVDEETEDGLAEALQAADVDVGIAKGSGQLVIHAFTEAYLSQSYFSPEKMLDFWKAYIRTAREKGFREFMITGEMTWALRKVPGVERLMEYEAKIDKMFSNYPQVIICQYNITRFSGDTIIDVLKTHSACILGGVLIKNHFYAPPDEFLKTLAERSDKPS